MTSYSNTGLSSSTAYYYRVRAYNGSGNSTYSNEANATTASAPVNLALNKPATASSTSSSANAASMAVDGDASTFWRSGNLNSNTVAWLQVDLGSTQTVTRVVINWRSTYYAKRYDVQVSDNASTWTTVYTDNVGNGGIDDVSFTAVAKRYVRVYMRQNNKNNERINEFEVYSGTAALAKNISAGEPSAAIPEEMTLRQNYPNPFNPTTQISFSVPRAVQVSLKIFNLAGQEVATLVNERREAGNYTVTFDASRLTSGVYFSVLQAGEVRQVRRLVLMK